MSLALLLKSFGDALPAEFNVYKADLLATKNSIEISWPVLDECFEEGGLLYDYETAAADTAAADEAPGLYHKRLQRQ